MRNNERERLDKMLRMGCICCRLGGLPDVPAEVSHILDGNRRMGHRFTLPICPSHHRGIGWGPEQSRILPKKYMVAIADGRKRFNAAFGSEKELWAEVQKALGLPVNWPKSKVGENV